MVQVAMWAMGGMVQAVTGAMRSDGEWQMKLRSLARCSPPAVRPGSQQTTDQYQSTAWGLGTPVLANYE